MVLTNVDLDLFLDHYDVDPDEIEYLGGWKFMGAHGLFKHYIDKWMEIKIQSAKNDNEGMRTIAKLMLNSLYGKFGSKPGGYLMQPFIDESGILRFTKYESDRKQVYLPMATFITAYARNKTIRSAQKLYDRIVYCDTDSMHLLGSELPEGIEIDKFKLGAWDHESTFRKAKFLRQKCYIEEVFDKKRNCYNLKVTCAGMPAKSHQFVTFENFELETTYPGKLTPIHVPGGVVLDPIDFTINP